MTGLSHEQTKHFLHLAADQCLPPQDRAAMEAHLLQCPPCRTYGQDLDRLSTTLGHALRVKWSAPYRSPIDMAGKVRRQLRENAQRQLLLGVTNVLVKLGSLAVAAALVVGIFTSQQTIPPAVAVSMAETPSGLVNGLSRFELRDMMLIQEGFVTPGLLPDDRQPTLPSSHLRALPY